MIGLSTAGAEWVDWTPDPRRVLAAGDRILLVARRAGLRVLVEQATPPPERHMASKVAARSEVSAGVRRASTSLNAGCPAMMRPSPESAL